MAYISLTKENIETEHICCAFSDKKCSESYELKKQWLKNEFYNGYVFRRLDERAKVFIEYCPAETAWAPVTAPNYNMKWFLLQGFKICDNTSTGFSLLMKKSLVEAIGKRKLSLKMIKVTTLEQAQGSPTPATIFSLFYKGKFVTTDISVCMDSRFDEILMKNKSVEYP